MASVYRPQREDSMRDPAAPYSKAFYDKILPPLSRSDFHGTRPVIPFEPTNPQRPGSSAAQQSHPPPQRSPSPTRLASPKAASAFHNDGGPGPQENGVRPAPVNPPRGSISTSAPSSSHTSETEATSAELPPLQAKSALEETDRMEPLSGELQGSFDLVAPPEDGHQTFSLEERSQQMFSEEHLRLIFASPSSLLRFTAFLSTHRSQSVPTLIYYLDALKALKAIRYANAIAGALAPIDEHPFTATTCETTSNPQLEERARQAFTSLAQQDLPAYITQIHIQIVSLSISRRITGNLAPHLRDASEGLAEVFCLTDPSRPDNPIVFASEEFNRTTRYGLSYVLGRNCRFLQGPKTNPLSVRRLGEAVQRGIDHCEVFLNYRRDGTPFMNLLMIAPLRDSRGKIRYFIGAQVDVSGLVKDCTDLDCLQQLVQNAEAKQPPTSNDEEGKDDFRGLSEMFNMAELETVRKYGGRMHKEYQEDEPQSSNVQTLQMPRLLLQDSQGAGDMSAQLHRNSGKLSGIYQNYLLIRPYPSFRILFASPTLRVPGILQSPFMDKVGGSSRVRDELSAALAEGRGVTAKIRWLSRVDEDGRNRWIHCTPLIGSNGQIGVWMVVLVDEDEEISRRYKQAPPVAGPHRGLASSQKTAGHRSTSKSSGSIEGAALNDGGVRHPRGERYQANGVDNRSASPGSVRL